MKVRERPKPSSPAASERMKANTSRNTSPEVILRKALWRAGLRGYRCNWKQVLGSPDIVFPRRRIAIFVNGCFWHKCPICEKTIPKANREYWIRKFQDNEERDMRIRGILEEDGWEVIVAWECLIRAGVDQIVDEILNVMSRRTL